MSALIYCPFPDAETARTVGERLLDEGLVGCVNIGGSIRSLFEWNRERGEGVECPVFFKTNQALLEQAITRLEDLHPYDAPAIMGWPCVGGRATQSWLAGLNGGSS